MYLEAKRRKSGSQLENTEVKIKIWRFESRGDSPEPVDHQKRTAGVSEKVSGKVTSECQEHEIWDVQWTGARQTAAEKSGVPGSAR